MTDAMREQIRSDAEDYADTFVGNPIPWWIPHVDGYIAGANAQHPIAYAQGEKEGKKEGIDLAILWIKNHQGHFWNKKDADIIIQELEALKR